MDTYVLAQHFISLVIGIVIGLAWGKHWGKRELIRWAQRRMKEQGSVTDGRRET